MTIRDPDGFLCGLRAAAAVTGVLKRAASIGLAAGALTLAGCGGPSAPRAPANTSREASTADAGVDAAADCRDDPGWNSACCKAADNQPAMCSPWGPPAPPAYAGERLS